MRMFPYPWSEQEPFASFVQNNEVKLARVRPMFTVVLCLLWGHGYKAECLEIEDMCSLVSPGGA